VKYFAAVCSAVLALVLTSGCERLALTNGLESPECQLPPGRLVAAMAVDGANERAILFGGIGDDRVHFDDVWALPLGSYRWRQLHAAGTSPGGRARHAMVYDPLHNRMLVFAGNNADGVLYNDLWALDLTPGRERWEKLAPSGKPPVPRTLPTVVYCPTRKSMLVFGGAIPGNGVGDVWELTLDDLAWHELTFNGRTPHARCSAGGFYDPDGNRMVIAGGVYNDFYNDVWALDLTPGHEHWDSLEAGGRCPSVRAGFASCYVPAARKMYVFAGWDGGMFNDLYSLDMATLTWTELSPAGRIPDARRNPACAYDPLNGNVLVFSGDVGGPGGWIPIDDSPYLQVVGELRWYQLPRRSWPVPQGSALQ
jgi:outer membrane protein assembly factor BamB